MGSAADAKSLVHHVMEGVEDSSIRGCLKDSGDAIEGERLEEEETPEEEAACFEGDGGGAADVEGILVGRRSTVESVELEGTLAEEGAVDEETPGLTADDLEHVVSKLTSRPVCGEILFSLVLSDEDHLVVSTVFEEGGATVDVCRGAAEDGIGGDSV